MIKQIVYNDVNEKILSIWNNGKTKYWLKENFKQHNNSTVYQQHHMVPQNKSNGLYRLQWYSKPKIIRIYFGY